MTNTPTLDADIDHRSDTGTPLSRLDAVQPIALAAVRIVLGYLLIRHGLDKFDAGLDNVGAQFSEWGVPAADASAVGVAVLELVGGLALILGVATRIAALSAALVLLGALWFVKFEMGVLGGSETDFAYLSGLVALIAVGPGRWSIDAIVGLDRS